MSISVFLFFAIIFVLCFMLRMARIGTLVAFLLAGIISGPYGLNLFELTDTWKFLGDLGILFLWFNIGLEINMKRLWRMRRTIFGFGAAQVLMVAVMMFPFLFGMQQWSIMGCIMVALLLAMSSTSEDLQLLADRNQLNTSMGQQTFSILLFQDLLSIPLLAMLPIFAGRSFNLGATVIDVFITSVLLILGVVVVGRFVLNPLLRKVSSLKSKELFLLTVMLNIILWAVVLAKLGLPSGLGAFLAGMLMSETIFRHQVATQISPYSMLFLSFFFIVLGMGLNLPVLLGNWDVILIGLAMLIAVKFVAIYTVARVRHVSIQDASLIALILAQGGEFGLLIFQTMKTSGITAIPPMHQEILTAIIILSIMMTPLLMMVYDWLTRTGRIFAGFYPTRINNGFVDKKPSVIICGFGRVGQIVAHMLKQQGVSYVAMDMDVDSVMQGREHGFNVVYGDATSSDILREFGLHSRSTRAVVIALDNASRASRAVASVHDVAPRVKIFARARNVKDSKLLLKQGVETALPETVESSFFLAYGVLVQLGISESKIDEMLVHMRNDNYAELDDALADVHEEQIILK